MKCVTLKTCYNDRKALSQLNGSERRERERETKSNYTARKSAKEMETRIACHGSCIHKVTHRDTM